MSILLYSFYLFYILKFPNKRIVFPSLKQKNLKKKKKRFFPFHSFTPSLCKLLVYNLNFTNLFICLSLFINQTNYPDSKFEV